MKSIYKVILISLLFVSAATAVDDRGKEEFVKSYDKEFDISRSGQVVLSNKYGNIDVKTNDGNKVIVKVEIIVNARNEDDANDAFERINIDFYSKSDYVKTETILESGKGGNWWGGNNKSYDFKINYDVSLPRTIELDVKNSYGDVYITELENDLNLDIKYGSFTVVKAQQVDIECKYGHGEIESCNDISADLSYVKESGGFRVGDCNNVELDTKYSKIVIKKAKTIIADAGYDNYEIGTAEVFKFDGNYNKIHVDDIGDISTDTKYTSIRIEDLRATADIEMGYGGLDIYTVHKGFKSILVDSDYGSVKIGVAPGASYSVNLDADYAGITVPEDLDIRIRDNGNTSKHIEGTMGSNPSGMIKVTSDYGSIRVR